MLKENQKKVSFEMILNGDEHGLINNVVSNVISSGTYNQISVKACLGYLFIASHNA